jgi:hypothetical protein
MPRAHPQLRTIPVFDQITCFTGTNVQILTQKASSWAFDVAECTCFVGTKMLAVPYWYKKHKKYHTTTKC